MSPSTASSRGARSIRPSLSPAFLRSRASTAPFCHRRARDRTQAGVTNRAVPARAARSARNVPRPSPVCFATPDGDHDVAHEAACLRGKRQDVGHLVLAAELAVERAHPAIGHDRDAEIAPRWAGAIREPATVPRPSRSRTFRPSGVATLTRRRAAAIRVVCLHDRLHELVPHDVALVEVDERDAVDLADDFHCLHET